MLGCTHYPYLINQLKEIAPEEMFINPAEAFAKYIRADLENENLIKTNKTYGTEQFYVSGNPENFKTAASIFYPIENLPEQIILN